MRVGGRKRMVVQHQAADGPARRRRLLPVTRGNWCGEAKPPPRRSVVPPCRPGQAERALLHLHQPSRPNPPTSSLRPCLQSRSPLLHPRPPHDPDNQISAALLCLAISPRSPSPLPPLPHTLAISAGQFVYDTLSASARLSASTRLSSSSPPASTSPPLNRSLTASKLAAPAAACWLNRTCPGEAGPKLDRRLPPHGDAAPPDNSSHEPLCDRLAEEGGRQRLAGPVAAPIVTSDRDPLRERLPGARHRLAPLVAAPDKSGRDRLRGKSGRELERRAGGGVSSSLELARDHRWYSASESMVSRCATSVRSAVTSARSKGAMAIDSTMDRVSTMSRVAEAKRLRDRMAARPHGGRWACPMLSGLMSRCITPLRCRYSRLVGGEGRDEKAVSGWMSAAATSLNRSCPLVNVSCGL
jgi:hypothetical protein